ncbi:MAG: DUF2294 domain-containing protein [Cyanobacteria bacterium J06636_16]
MSITNLEKATRKQLERSLSKQLQELYLKRLDHKTGEISCQLMNSNLTMIVEGSLTQPEQLLLEIRDQPDLIAQVRSRLNDMMRSEVIDLIEKTLSCKVIDFMSNTTLETSRTGAIVVLSDK